MTIEPTNVVACVFADAGMRSATRSECYPRKLNYFIQKRALAQAPQRSGLRPVFFWPTRLISLGHTLVSLFKSNGLGEPSGAAVRWRDAEA